MTRALELTPAGRIKLSEEQVQAACIDLLRAEHYRVFETHSRRAFASAGDLGQPDLVGVRSDGVLFIECKAPGKKQSREQIDWGQRARKDGYTYLVVDDVAELRATLAAVGLAAKDGRG